MSRAILTVAMVLLSTAFAHSQTFKYVIDDLDRIPPSVHAERRDHLVASMDAASVAIVMAAEVRNRQNDVDYEYRQNSNLLYLTGFPHPNAVLVLAPSGIPIGSGTHTEVLFVKDRDASREQWSGVTAGPEEAMQFYGIDTAVSMEELVPVMDILFGDERGEGGSVKPPTLYLDGWPTKKASMPILGRNLYVDTQTKRALREKYPGLKIKSAIPQLNAMREIKDTAELRLMRRAIDITMEGHRTAMRGAEEGMSEYQIEALMEYAFRYLGAEDVGYPSIVGSSYNACILHYTTNRREMNTGDLILADCGAEYHGYTADVTRTFPLDGAFTDEQKIIYRIVLEAQDSGIAASVSGAPFRAPHKAALSVVARRLAEIGVISDADDDDQVKQYFMHGTSHYLGLDVHDAGTRGPLKPNTVITVEPGIYIPEGSPCDEKWWNIGVRIEDDILVTEGAPENLSGALPRTVEGIEALMREPLPARPKSIRDE